MRSRSNQRDKRLVNPDSRASLANSRAHNARSEQTATIGPTGVSKVWRRSTSLHQMPDDLFLLRDQLPDAVAGKIEERFERLGAERTPLGRPLHLDESAVAGLA